MLNLKEFLRFDVALITSAVELSEDEKIKNIKLFKTSVKTS